MSYPFLYQQQQQQQQHHHQLGRLNQNYGLACSATNHNLTSSNPVIYKHQQQNSNSHMQSQPFHHSALKNYNPNNNLYSNLKVKQISSTQAPPVIPPSVLSKLANSYLPSGFKELNISNSNNNINLGSPKKGTIGLYLNYKKYQHDFFI